MIPRISTATDRSGSMADDTIASVIPLHYAPSKKREKKGTERAKSTRQRKRKAKVTSEDTEAESSASASLLPSEFLIPPEFLPANDVVAESPPAPSPAAVTPLPNQVVTPSRGYLAPVLLSIAALALAAV